MNISKNIDENLNFIKNAMSIPLSSDAILREFTIHGGGKTVRAFLVYYEGIASGQSIDQFILQSLHLMPRDENLRDLKDLIANQLLSANQLSVETEFSKVFQQVNYGGCAVFADTVDAAFVLDVKNWERRGIDTPVTETVTRGSQEAFIETMRINTGLVRRLVRQEKLICEDFRLGSKSHTPCNLLYIKDTVDDALVCELRRRLNAIDAEYIIDSGELEQLLEEFTFLPTPQILSTERPDRVAAALMEGKAAVILDGTPFVLVMPINAFDLIHTTEDRALRMPYANLVRVMRMIALMISLLLPAAFIAVSNFHQEVIPVHLLFAIAASRQGVPFSTLTELILFEIAFEIIREASVRIPASAGNAMGIIGGLIIGQAAVDANIVSPIVIIIVALTGIGSFTTPNYSLNFAFRITKYGYIVLAAVGGFLGLAMGIIVHLVLLCNSQSLGMPFLAPFSAASNSKEGTFFVKPIWKRFGYRHPRNWARGVQSTVSGPEDPIDIY